LTILTVLVEFDVWIVIRGFCEVDCLMAGVKRCEKVREVGRHSFPSFRDRRVCLPTTKINHHVDVIIEGWNCHYGNLIESRECRYFGWRAFNFTLLEDESVNINRRISIFQATK
jgi:hypothetical protein